MAARYLWFYLFFIIGYVTYASSKKHLAGLVLARKGSKGIAGKNMVILNGKPLIAWSIQAMIESKSLDSIWISTNDPSVENWVNSTLNGDIFLHHRADYTATDTASSLIAVKEFLSHHPEVDTVALVQATSPFIKATYVSQAAALSNQFKSVFAVTRSFSLRWKELSEHEKIKPLNFDPLNRPRRQDWNGELIENGMFYFADRNTILEHHTFQNARSLTFVEIPKLFSLEIDSMEDLEIARALFPLVNEMKTSVAGMEKTEL